jgi:type IV secretion system protein VirB10
MSDDVKIPKEETPQEEEKFELSPEEATGLDGGKPGVINRKRILIVVCIFFSVFICGGLIANLAKNNKKSSASEEDLYAADSSGEFLNSLQNRALYNRKDEAEQTPEPEETKEAEKEKEPLLPPAYITSNSRAVDSVRPQPQQQYSGGGGSAPSSSQSNEPPPTHFKSSLIPPVEGRLFSSPQYSQPAAATAANNPARSQAADYYGSLANRANPYDRASDYTVQNDQQNKMEFYGSPEDGAGSGFFIGENTLWTGTIIPGVLETAINTDLPGNIIARVTQNIFDSQTGQNLLIPQGTLLLARYNSSVSYAQHRVQIIWDSMIRPDGFMIDLGSNAVDKAGMSGQAAKYHENWFEYLKAAGIITLFSVANAKMTEAAAKYSSEASAGNIAASNSNFVNQVGGNFVNRAMNIQPTLTVDNGTEINVMLNRTIYLPPVPSYPPSQKYILE